MARSDIERLRRRIAGGDSSPATAEAWLRATSASAPPSDIEESVRGCKFVVIEGQTWDWAATPRDLVAYVKRLNSRIMLRLGPPDDEDYERLLRWGREARPGDAISGFWEVTWIFAVRADAKNERGGRVE